MLDMDAERLSEIVDSGKPGFDAGEETNVFSHADEGFPVDGQVLLLGKLDHLVHVDEERIHMMEPGKSIALFPKFARMNVQGRNECIVLHVGRRQGLVEIIEKRDLRFLFHFSFLG